MKCVGNKWVKKVKKTMGRMVKTENSERKSRKRRVKRRRKLVQTKERDQCGDWWTRGDRPKQKLTYTNCITFLTEIGVIIVFEGMGRVWIIDAQLKKKED